MKIIDNIPDIPSHANCYTNEMFKIIVKKGLKVNVWKPGWNIYYEGDTLLTSDFGRDEYKIVCPFVDCINNNINLLKLILI